MGSCNAKDEEIVISHKTTSNHKKLDMILLELKECMDPKFRDMPEWDGNNLN